MDEMSSHHLVVAKRSVTAWCRSSAGGKATLRLFGGAHHSFDRGTPIETVTAASVSPAAPTSYIDADGAFVRPLTGRADAGLTDRDMALYGIKAGYGRKGARSAARRGTQRRSGRTWSRSGRTR